MKVNIRNLSQFILVFLMVMMHGAVYWSVNFQESYIAIFAVILLDLVIAARYLGSIPTWFLVYCVATAACYFLSAFTNGIGLSTGLNIKTALILDMNILTVLVAYRMDRSRALRLFVLIVTFFAAFSLVFYFTTLVIGKDSIARFFTYYSWGRGHYVNPLYSFTKDDRNYGIFYEPGVYQIVLNTALYLLLFARDKLQLSNRVYNFSFIVLIVTVITSGSTTGYLNLAFILLGMVLLKGKSGIQRRVGYICGIFILMLATDYIVNGDDSLISTYVLSKIFETQLTTSAVNYNTSGGARLFIFSLAIEALKSNPLFGLGANYVSDAVSTEFYSGFGTGNGLCAMIASKGLVTTAITIAPFLYMAYKNRSSGIQYLVLILVYFNTVAAQSSFAIMCCSFALLCMNDFGDFEYDECEANDCVMEQRYKRDVGGVLTPEQLFSFSKINSVFDSIERAKTFRLWMGGVYA